MKSIGFPWKFQALFPVLIGLYFNSLPAQKSAVTGVVLDALKQEPVEGAYIQANGFVTASDEQGKFLMNLEPGTYDLEVSYIGYQTYRKDLVVPADRQLELKIELEEAIANLQTLTVTSGRFEKPLSEVVVSLEVLKSNLLQSTNTTQVDKVLNKIPGVDIIDGQANIRGGSGFSYGAGSRVMLLLDDLPILSVDAGYPNWADLPVENIEQIEVLKGASSALYGTAALNGIINVRTAVPKDRPETRIAPFVTAYLSPSDKAKKWWDTPPTEAGISLSHRQRIGKHNLVLGGYYFDERSYLKERTNRYGRIQGSWRYRVNDRLSAGLNLNFNKGKGNNYFYFKNAQSGAYTGDTSTATTSDRFRFNIDPFLTYFDKAGNRHKFMARYNSIDNNNNDNQSNQSATLYLEYQFQKHWERLNLDLTSGLVGIQTKISAPLYGDASYKARNYAAYLQAEKKLGDKFNLSGGLRYEYNAFRTPEVIFGDTIPGGRLEEGKLIYRVGANYQLAEYSFLRASYGLGYRFPTLAEKFISTYFGGFPIAPNLDLGSETGWSAELGIKQGYQLGGLRGFLDLSLFWTEYFNMIEFNLAADLPLRFQAQNIGDTRIRGLDVTLMGSARIGEVPINIYTGYTYIDPRYIQFTERINNLSSSDRNILKYRYAHTFKWDSEASYKRFKAGLAVFYNSNMEAIDGIFELIIQGLAQYRDENTNGEWVFDARTSYQVSDACNLSLICRNLGNNEVIQRPGIMEAPRNVTLRADFTF